MNIEEAIEKYQKSGYEFEEAKELMRKYNIKEG